MKVSKKAVKMFIKLIAGAILGGLLGYLYYIKVGCSGGSCPITSNPYVSAIYGAIIGLLISSLFGTPSASEKKR